MNRDLSFDLQEAEVTEACLTKQTREQSERRREATMITKEDTVNCLSRTYDMSTASVVGVTTIASIIVIIGTATWRFADD